MKQMLLYAKISLLRCLSILETALATGQYIPPSGVEVISVPGGGYLLIRVAGVFHQEVHLVVEVAAADAIHVAEVGLIHSNEQVVLLVSRLRSCRAAWPPQAISCSASFRRAGG